MARQISNTTLSKFVRAHMRPTDQSALSQTLVQASDPTIELPTRALLDTIIADIKPKMPDASDYTQDGKFDCDDYSFIFKGLIGAWYQENRSDDMPLAFGIGWGRFKTFSVGTYHALNWVFLADDEKLYWIEPQFVHGKSIDEATELFDKNVDRVNLIMI